MSSNTLPAPTEPFVYRGKAGSRQFRALTLIDGEWVVTYSRTGDILKSHCSVQDWEAWCKQRGAYAPPPGTVVVTKGGKILRVVEYRNDRVLVYEDKEYDVTKLSKMILGMEVDESDARVEPVSDMLYPDGRPVSVDSEDDSA